MQRDVTRDSSTEVTEIRSKMLSALNVWEKETLGPSALSALLITSSLLTTMLFFWRTDKWNQTNPIIVWWSIPAVFISIGCYSRNCMYCEVLCACVYAHLALCLKISSKALCESFSHTDDFLNPSVTWTALISISISIVFIFCECKKRPGPDYRYCSAVKCS